MLLLDALALLYSEEDHGIALPGEPPAEIADAMTAVDEAAGRALRRVYRLSAEERQAIELHAVKLATGHLIESGYRIRDVGATRSYDLHATRDGQTLYVEVKGTTSTGGEIILTRNEVDLHAREYPHTMLIIVNGVELGRATTPPTATGGELRIYHPWQADASRLTPLAFRYVVEPEP